MPKIEKKGVSCLPLKPSERFLIMPFSVIAMLDDSAVTAVPHDW